MAGSQFRGEDESVIVAVRHDEGSHEPRRNAPRRRPGVDFLAVLILELDLLGLREVLPQEMRRSRLQGLPILHHRFDCERRHRSGEAFAFRLLASDHRHRHVLFGERGVDIEHPSSLFARFGFRRVYCMAFLPEELGRTQKHSRTQLPANDVAPLVEQDGQIAIRLDPLGEHGSDDGLAGRADDQRFLELAGWDEASFGARFEPVVRHDSALLGEPFDVLGFLLEKAHRDEERKVGVLVASLFEHVIERRLHVFPDGEPPRLDDHAAAHRGDLGQVGSADHLLIPLGVVFLTCRFDRRPFLLAHQCDSSSCGGQRGRGPKGGIAATL